MTSRERVIRALTFNSPDRVPRELWALPGVCKFRTAEHQAMVARFEWDFAGPPVQYGPSDRARGDCNNVGNYTDEWGVVWTNAEAGVVGEIKQPILEDETAIDRYQLPWELLDKIDLSRVDDFCTTSTRFVKAGTHVRPFERLQFLRGTENVLVDLAYGTPSVMGLLARLHEFFKRPFFQGVWPIRSRTVLEPP